MDLILDQKQGRKFDCSTCDPNLQKLRNCGGKFGEKSQAIMIVNDTKYEVCPRYMTLGKYDLGLMVSTYLDCKDGKRLPYGQSMIDQTAYCRNVFEFLDDIVNTYQAKQQKEYERKMEKMNKKAKLKGKGSVG